MSIEREFVTSDLYLSAAIICLKPTTKLSFKVQNGRTLFVFQASDNLFGAMDAYNDGSPVNAFEYAQTIKKLRAEMIMRREQR